MVSPTVWATPALVTDENKSGKLISGRVPDYRNVYLDKYIVIFQSAHFKLDLIIKDVHRHLADNLCITLHCIHYILHITMIQIQAKDIDKKLEAYFKSQVFGFLSIN